MAYKNIERQREYQREYMKEWRKKNPDKKYKEVPNRQEQKRKALANWRIRNPGKHRENGRLWRKDNMGYVVFMNTQRRLRIKNIQGKHSYKEWLELKKAYNHTCPSCKMIEPNIKLTEDHIVPISLGGNNAIGNIQPLCSRCNSKKYQQIIKYEL